MHVCRVVVSLSDTMRIYLIIWTHGPCLLHQGIAAVGKVVHSQSVCKSPFMGTWLSIYYDRPTHCTAHQTRGARLTSAGIRIVLSFHLANQRIGHHSMITYIHTYIMHIFDRHPMARGRQHLHMVVHTYTHTYIYTCTLYTSLLIFVCVLLSYSCIYRSYPY